MISDKVLLNGKDPHELRIDFLINSSILLSNKLPSVSHSLMRNSICFLKDTKRELSNNDYLNICKRCGVVFTPCVNLEVRCVKNDKRARKRTKKLFKRDFKNLDTFKKNKNNLKQNLYYKNRMVICTDLLLS
uniref:Unspecified product n=1 Tax=Theileria annulata TaxID=5874 RepID=A0A3B0MVW9_THEAN